MFITLLTTAALAQTDMPKKAHPRGSERPTAERRAHPKPPVVPPGPPQPTEPDPVK